MLRASPRPPRRLPGRGRQRATLAALIPRRRQGPSEPVCSGDFPDPFVFRRGDRYFAYGTQTGDLNVPADLGERTEQALRQTALDRLGMEARAGNLINGSDKVDNAARSRKVAN